MATRVFPIQARDRRGRWHSAKVNEQIYMSAYEVYRSVFGEQQAIVEGDCRGGFGAGELIAFLYAKSFPRSEWRQRVDEALTDLDIEG